MFFELMMRDLRGIFADLRPHDFGTPFFWVMWLTIVAASLRGVDRRDEIAQITYMAFVSAFGVLFLVIFPIGHPKKYTPAGQLILFCILLLIPSVRWMLKRRLTELDRRVAEAKSEAKTK